MALRKSAPSSHSKEDQELKVPLENPTAPTAPSDIKIKPVHYLSVALTSERIKQEAKVWCAFSLPLLGGIQLFFKPGNELGSPALHTDFLLSEPPGKPNRPST